MIMKHLNVKAFLWIVIPFSMLLWIFLILFSKLGADLAWGALKKIPTVITVDLVFWVCFTKWAWKWRIFQGWLVPFPVLEGTWTGIMKSTWKSPESNQPLPAIPVTLVIQQSFLYLSCTIYTKESGSYSYSSDIVIDKETKTVRLIYHFTNRPLASVRHRSEIHDGTALLVLIGGNPVMLKGEYWTSRKTTGDIEVEYLSREPQHGLLSVKDD